MTTTNGDSIITHGSFTENSYLGVEDMNGHAAGSVKSYIYGFDPSLSSALYGGSETVQPKSFRLIPAIKF